MARTSLRIGVALLCLSLGPIASAEPRGAADLAAAFGARAGVEQASLSPDGTRVAWLAPLEGQASVILSAAVDGGGKAQPALKVDGSPTRLGSCDWVSGKRLVCDVYGVVTGATDLLPFSRVVALNIDGTDQRVLSRSESMHARGINLSGDAVIDWLPDDEGSVLMTRIQVPDDRIGTRLGSTKSGLGVDRIDTVTGKARSAQSPIEDAWEYLSDGHGNVRIMGLMGRTPVGYASGEITYLFRRKDSDKWEPLGKFDAATREGFEPRVVDAGLDAAYGFRKEGGRLGVYRKSLDGSGTEERVYARDDVDVDGLITIGPRNRVVGVSYATDVRYPHYTDPGTGKLLEALAKALPGQKQLRVVDASLDESRVLLWAGSDDDPGVYYLFDKPGRELKTLMVVRPQLEGMTLARMQPMTYRALDGTEVPAYLTLPPGAESAAGLPGLVLPHGGPSARDEWGFDWLSQFFAARGFAVLQPNFRGSAGYGDAWLQQNGFKSWRTAVGDVLDAGRWLVQQGVSADQLAILGWSYGGYAALQSAATEPELFKAVVAIAPVTDLEMLRQESRNFSDYVLVKDFIGEGPHVTEGSPLRHAEQIKAPVLLFHGARDAHVGVAQSEAMADRMKQAGKSVQRVTWDELDHYLLDSAARARLLLDSDRFLRDALKVE